MALNRRMPIRFRRFITGLLQLSNTTTGKHCITIYFNYRRLRFSRVLKGAELYYGITDKECLSVGFGVKESRVYLHGRHFLLRTEHWALKWMMTMKEPNGSFDYFSIWV